MPGLSIAPAADHPGQDWHAAAHALSLALWLQDFVRWHSPRDWHLSSGLSSRMAAPVSFYLHKTKICSKMGETIG